MGMSLAACGATASTNSFARASSSNARLDSSDAHNCRVITVTKQDSTTHLSNVSLLIPLFRLGENQWTMSALYAFMLDRVTAGDLDGTLVISILKVRPIYLYVN